VALKLPKVGVSRAGVRAGWRRGSSRTYVPLPFNVGRLRGHRKLASRRFY
jgi:hypothetical protein